MWAMMLWYPLVLPFVLIGGIFRTYVIVWGLLFFTLSSVVLNLGSLAEFEFIFWAALFWSRTGLSNHDKITIYYDDKCNLCDKTVRYICLLDIFSRVKLKPVSQNHKQLKALGIDPGDALTDLYGVCDGDKTIKFGYDFYILLARKIVLLWPFYPLLMAGEIMGLGRSIYRKIASRRVELFGVCTLSSVRQRSEQDAIFNRDSLLQKTAAAHIVLLSALFIVFMPAPYIGIPGSYNAASQSAHYYGITPIDVFNKSGERLAFHESDRIYFGGTLIYRRAMIADDSCAIKNFLSLMVYLSQVYLEQKNSEEGTYRFRYRQYHRPNPDGDSLAFGTYRQNKVELRCDATFELEHKT